MEKLRIYIGTQPNCKACEITKRALGESVSNVSVFEVDLTSEVSTKRRLSMGVRATPTVFIVGGSDTNNNGVWEEIEEKYIFHQTGIIYDKANLSSIVGAIRNNKIIKTNL